VPQLGQKLEVPAAAGLASGVAIGIALGVAAIIWL
jgi:hypothetical protein